MLCLLPPLGLLSLFLTNKIRGPGLGTPEMMSISSKDGESFVSICIRRTGWNWNGYVHVCVLLLLLSLTLLLSFPLPFTNSLNLFIQYQSDFSDVEEEALPAEPSKVAAHLFTRRKLLSKVPVVFFLHVGKQYDHTQEVSSDARYSTSYPNPDRVCCRSVGKS